LSGLFQSRRSNVRQPLDIHPVIPAGDRIAPARVNVRSIAYSRGQFPVRGKPDTCRGPKAGSLTAVDFAAPSTFKAG
jgi:hypothetical protein